MNTSKSTTFAPLRLCDVADAAQLHERAFPNFFLSILGRKFLVELYRGAATDASGISVVARGSNGGLRGVAIGTTSPNGFYRRLILRRWPWLLAAFIQTAIAHPTRVPRLVRTMRRPGQVPLPISGCLLSSICVDPNMRHSGEGRRLLAAWTEAAIDSGTDAAFLTTDATDNDRVNTFYVLAGWHLGGQFTTRSRRSINCYTRQLGAPR